MQYTGRYAGCGELSTAAATPAGRRHPYPPLFFIHCGKPVFSSTLVHISYGGRSPYTDTYTHCMYTDESIPNISDTRQVPYDIAVEESLVGTLLWNAERFHDVIDIVEPEAFYSPRCRHIFEAMFTVAQRGGAIDPVTVGTQLADNDRLDSVGGREYIRELVDRSPSTVNPDSYAKIIQDKYTRRRLQKSGVAIAELSADNTKEVDVVLDESEKELFEITQHHTHARYRDIASFIPDLVEEIITVSEGSNRHRGVPTGYTKLDNCLSGLHPSDLVILAARPSVGKTALALDIARRSSMSHKTSVGIFSLEMSTAQLIERILSTEARLDAWRMRTGRLRTGGTKTENEFDALNQAADRLSTLPIYVDDRSSMSTLNIRSTARRMKREHDIGLLIVDYLQLISPHETRKSDSLVQHITEVSRTLKQVARELAIPVLALSQLSRDIEKRAGKPRLSDLRDSGSIEQDADVVLFLHRELDTMYEGEENAPIPTKIIIGKHRNGPVGEVSLNFDKKYATFVEVDSAHQDTPVSPEDVPF